MFFIFFILFSWSGKCRRSTVFCFLRLEPKERKGKVEIPIWSALSDIITWCRHHCERPGVLTLLQFVPTTRTEERPADALKNVAFLKKHPSRTKPWRCGGAPPSYRMDRQLYDSHRVWGGTSTSRKRSKKVCLENLLDYSMAIYFNLGESFI